MREASDRTLPLFAEPPEPRELAAFFEADFPLEFVGCPCFDPDYVAALALEGFIPMAMAHQGRELLLPKLHLERCLLDPAELLVTRTARRESRGYSLSVDDDFPAVLRACAAIHGDDWLRPPLVDAFLALADRGGDRGLSLHSFELRREGRLVAGEIGALVGACYTSWSGFREPAGSGTVQLAALGRALELAGIEVWDLGMVMGYKLALGARALERGDFLALFRAARQRPGPSFAFLPAPARALIDRSVAAEASIPGTRKACGEDGSLRGEAS